LDLFVYPNITDQCDKEEHFDDNDHNAGDDINQNKIETTFIIEDKTPLVLL